MKLKILGLALLILVSCKNEEENKDELAFMKEFDGIRSESFGVTYYFSDSARVTAELKAAHIMEKEENDKGEKVFQIVDQGLRLNFLDGRGKPHSYIESDSGRFDLTNKLGGLFKNVHLVNSKGETLDTEALYWNEKKDSIFTDQLVRIETADKIIIGKKGFRSNTEFSEYIIYGIEGEIASDENL
jgi:hypothetical protein